MSDYVPPLRAAVLFAGRYDVPVSAEAMATWAGVSVDRAKSYASILVARRVLRRTADGWVRGGQWSSWSRTTSGARPPRSHSPSADAMDRMRMAFGREVRDRASARGWDAAELARQAGVGKKYADRLLERGKPPPLSVAALIAHALGISLDELMRGIAIEVAERVRPSGRLCVVG